MYTSFKNQSVERTSYITERVKESSSVTKQDPYRRGITLQYKLIATTDGSETAALFKRENNADYSTVYSILIIKTVSDKNGTYDETVFIYDITRCKDAALRLLTLLSENYVTPDEAKDVIDDLL